MTSSKEKESKVISGCNHFSCVFSVTGCGPKEEKVLFEIKKLSDTQEYFAYKA